MTNDFLHSKAYEQLRQYAVMENSPLLYAMLQMYNFQPERWESPEDFLADTVLMLAATLSDTQTQLVDVVSKSPSPNICMNCGQPLVTWR